MRGVESGVTRVSWGMFSRPKVAEVFLLKRAEDDLLMAARVMSLSWRADLEVVACETVEERGVKNRLKRFGVIGGGFFGLEALRELGGLNGPAVAITRRLRFGVSVQNGERSGRMTTV